MAERDVASWTILFQAYAHTGHLHSAFSVFHVMPEWTVFSWTALLTAYASHGCIHKAKELFDVMPPDRSVVCWNALVSAYAQNGHLRTACLTFERMPLHSVVSWNALLQANAQNGRLGQALATFKQMPERVESSWNALLAAFAQTGHLEDATATFARMPSVSLPAWNTMIRAGMGVSEAQAKNVFDSMPQRDLVSWNSLLAAYARHGHLAAATKAFGAMPHRGIASWTAMFTAYAHSGDANGAASCFQQMPCRDSVSWNAALSLCVHGDLCKEALNIFKFMDLEGQPPEATTYALVFYACAQLSEHGLHQGRTIHSCMVDSGFFLSNQQQNQQVQVVATSLMAMYANCGCMDESRRVFEHCRCSGIAAAARVWNAMLTAHAQDGNAAAVLKLLQEMESEGVQPDGATLVIVISACSRAGLLQTGRRCFIRLPADYGISVTADHYTCIHDLLSRSGQLEP